MNQQIFFLGSATDPARSLAQHLCCDLPPDNELGDLSDILVILPGKQARRSVMRELASFRRIMLIPSFITVSSFRRMGIPANRQEPSLLEKKILWMEVFSELAAGEFPDLFPEEPVKTPRTLAVLADQILALYHELELGSGNLNISSVNEKLNGADRNFPDLAELERRYLEKLSFHSLTEPFQQQIDPKEEARYFLKFRKIIVAACPDLPPFAREKLIRLQQCFEMFAACGEQVPQISICITAPASWCDCFDSWGCLIPEQWDNVVLPFAPGKIHSVPDVREMADLAAKLSLTERVDEMGGIHQELDCADTAVVVTHPDFFADLEKAFSGIRTEKGERLSLYNPDGVSMGKLRLVTFCRTLCDLMDGEKLSFEAVRTFLRQEYVLEYFAKSFRMSADHLLKALDIYYLIRLPDIISIPDLPDVQVLAKLCRNGYPSMETACIEQGNLLEIFRRIDSFREKLLIPGQWIENLRILCTEVFSLESYPEKAGIGLDEEAAVFREILSGLEKSPIFTSLDPVTAMLLFTGELSRGKLYADHPEDSLEITGFLDMPFRNASRVILCGMSEGLLPERTAATPYLNDELRKLLSLPDSDAKYARDCFYVRLLLDKTAGDVHFISPKINSDKSLLGFSPFYFTGLKNPEEILKRCGILFENYPIPAKSSAGKNIPFHAFADLSGAFRCGDKTVLSVTGFSVLLESYLYAALANIYGIGETAYDFPELDTSVQGTIVHAALQKFSLTGEQLTSFRSGDPVRKNKALTSAFEDLNELFLEEVYRRCGREDLALLPKIQTERWEMRLRKTVEKLLEDSCPVLEKEWKLNGGNGVEWEESVLIKGTIDRIEYDEENGILRLIDFKTGNVTEPAPEHLSGKYFKNLQLPLYKMLLRKDPVFREKYSNLDLDQIRILCGYFSLSSVTGNIGYYFWKDMDQFDQTAEKTVDQVIRAVRKMQQGILPEEPGKFSKYDPGQQFFPYGYMETFGPLLRWEASEEKIPVPSKAKERSAAGKKKGSRDK